jgi:hypothetical protein
MRVTLTRHVSLLVATVVIALVSSVLLGLPWYRLTVAGRTHSYSLGPLPLFPLLDSFPFSWPFALTAFAYRRLGPAAGAAIWSFATALAGVALYCLIARVQFAADAPLGASVSVATRFTAPVVYSAAGFLSAHLWRVRQTT